MAALVGAAVAATGYVAHVVHSTPPLSKLHAIVSGGNSQVFAADSTRLGFIQSDELRTPVGWREIPANLKNATVAIEDQRFYKNDGIDLTGIFRAAVKDITRGAAVQGGSTITMQLVRNLYLGGDEHTLKQKIIEAKYAFEYGETHSKRSILTTYLNTVPYGTLGGQTALGRAGCGAHLLRQVGVRAEPRAVRPARRIATGAVGIQPRPGSKSGTRTA